MFNVHMFSEGTQLSDTKQVLIKDLAFLEGVNVLGF